MAGARKHFREILLLVALAVSCWVAYSPVRKADFINLDDPEYVLNNVYVTEGMTPANLQWALTATRASNWHPVTWWSHQGDAELWGRDAFGHHTSSLLLHILTSLLVYSFISRLTGNRQTAAVVAGLFALHPVNVESVAWISERKSVLSTLFGMGALIAYLSYCRSPSFVTYLAVTVLLAFSLMAKPMLVTLPFVLLLIDDWPLDRLRPPHETRYDSREVVRRVLEKLPWLLMAAVSSVVTMGVQQDARATMNDLSMGVRLENAAYSYVSYLGLLVWPVRLAVCYPHPLDSLPAWKVVGAALFLAVATAGALWKRSVYRLGWLWYLGTLIPVLGIAQVGKQAMADRYLYWPALGIFLIFASAGEGLARRVGWYVWLGIVLLVLAACATATYRQASHWESAATLMEHTVRHYPENGVALYLAGMAHEEEGNLPLARQRLEGAVRVAPMDLQAGLAYAKFLIDCGEVDQAFAEYERLAKVFPTSGELQLWRGVAYARHGNFAAAMEDLRAASRVEALAVDANYNLGLIAARGKDWENAQGYFVEALRREPGHEGSLLALAAVVEQSGERSVDSLLRRGIEIAPNPRKIAALANLHLSRGEWGTASELLAQGTARFTTEKTLWYLFAVAQLQQGNEPAAVTGFRRTLQIDPEHLAALNDLAWLLATTRDDNLPISEAVLLAKRAQAMAPEDPAILDTLAASLAAVGQFDEALEVVERGLKIAEAQKHLGVRQGLRQRGELYRRGLPFRRDPTSPNVGSSGR